jgi:hypothetical protein
VSCDRVCLLQVSCVDVNPRVPTLVLTTGGDHLMRLWDARKDSEPLFTVKHARMVRGVLVFVVHLPIVSLPWAHH